MDASNSSNIRTLISDGNLEDLLSALEPDRREDYVVVCPDMRGDNDPIVLAQVGRALLVCIDNSVQIRVHGHPEDEDDACWLDIVRKTQERVTGFNSVALMLRDSESAQGMLQAGMPLPMVAAFHNVDLSVLETM